MQSVAAVFKVAFPMIHPRGLRWALPDAVRNFPSTKPGISAVALNQFVPIICNTLPDSVPIQLRGRELGEVSHFQFHASIWL